MDTTNNDVSTTAEKAFAFFNQGQAVVMAIAIADLLVGVDQDEVTDTAVKNAGFAIGNLLRAASIEQDDKEARDRRVRLDNLVLKRVPKVYKGLKAQAEPQA